MTFSELVAEVAQQTGVSKTETAKVLRGFVQVTSDTVMAGEGVRLLGLGVFVHIDLPPAKLTGALTGKRMSGARRKIRFKQSRRKTP